MSITAIALIATLGLQGGKLEIKDNQVGKGLEAKAGDIITVDYTGKLTDGKQFDTSIGKKPFQFILGAGQVIKGWDQGVVGMKPGGQRTLTIPSDLAYGDNGVADVIPPKATLVFDVSLIKIDRIEAKVITPGKGDQIVQGGDTCEFNYELQDKDGKKIVNGADRKETLTVIVGRSNAIKGLTAGVIGMKQGEKRHIVIPPEFGFGDKGAGDLIKPNQTLYFDLELVKLMKGGKN